MPLFPSLSPHFVYSPLFLLRGILSAPGRLLFPSPSVSLSHFASRPFFYLFCLYGSPPLLTFVASLLLSHHWFYSPWANECPSAAVCGPPERARGTQLVPLATGCTRGIPCAFQVQGAPRRPKGGLGRFCGSHVGLSLEKPLLIYKFLSPKAGHCQSTCWESRADAERAVLWKASHF